MTEAQPHIFHVHPLERFVGKCEKVKRPKEITSFSYNDNHQLIHDDSSLRYYYDPDIPSDLNRGFETFDKHDDSVDEHLDSLLAALVQLDTANKETGSNTVCTTGIDVVTWRGVMTKIMTIPYLGNGFEMNAAAKDARIGETVLTRQGRYIEENFPFKQSSRGTQDLGQEKMSFWGYKFETLSTLPCTWHECTRDYIEGRKEERVSNKAQYCSIVKTTIGSTSMILAGEVDAVWDCKPLDKSRPINYVELKTSKEIYNDRDNANFERKLQRFWAQSFLLGVPKLIVGFRDNYGILKKVETIQTEMIPAMVKKNRNAVPWDGNVVINFTAKLLSWIKETIGHSEGMWRLRFREKGNVVEVFKVDSRDTGAIFSSLFLEARRDV